MTCQNISAAGKGEGITGEKSSLWKEYKRAIGVLRPRYAIIENSPMLVTQGLDVVLSDLAEMRYDAEWGCLSAGTFGALHERERIWIIAYPDTVLQRVQGGVLKPFQGIDAVQRFQGIRGIEDLQNRPSVPRPILRGVDNAPASWMDRLKCVGNGHFPACTYFIGQCILRAEGLIS